jgi:hypothetical protein
VIIYPFPFFMPGNMPIILHNTISITSSAPPPIEVSSGKPGFAYRTRKLDPDYSTSGFLVR